jgi:hypothetical protein
LFNGDDEFLEEANDSESSANWVFLTDFFIFIIFIHLFKKLIT